MTPYSEEQAQYDWLVLRWSNFAERPFPRGLASVEVEGVCLVLLDADLASLVGAFVERRQLRPGGVKAL